MSTEFTEKLHIGDFDKNSCEKVMVDLVENKGRFYVDIRSHKFEDGQYRHTPKGLMIGVDKLKRRVVSIDKGQIIRDEERGKYIL